jgi:hypothetical protein
VALLMISLTPIGALSGTIAAIIMVGTVAWYRVRKLPSLIGGAVADAARQFGLCVAADSTR